MKLSNHEHLPAWDQMTHSDKVRILAAEYLLGWKWYPASKNSQQCILAPTPEDVDLVRYGEHIASLVPKMDIDTAEAVLKTIGIDEPLEHIASQDTVYRLEIIDGHDTIPDAYYRSLDRAIAAVEAEYGAVEWFIGEYYQSTRIARECDAINISIVKQEVL